MTVGELWNGLLKMRSVLKTLPGKYAGTRRGDTERDMHPIDRGRAARELLAYGCTCNTDISNGCKTDI